MTKEELKQRAVQAVEDAKEELIAAGRALNSMPEPGYREVKTGRFVKEQLEKCGLSVESGLALTGLRAKAEGRKSEDGAAAGKRINVGVMGELDSLIMPQHAGADPVTGAFHGCGHHSQLTTVIGTAIGLVRTGLLRELDGDLTFFAVPAEESVEAEYRNGLVRSGKIRFTTGKAEFIRLGLLDDVDMVMMSHIMGNEPEPHSWIGHNWNGVINKTVFFTGKAAHAALAPWNGINALQAAVEAINHINALRGSFRDEDHVRIHFIITKGGSSCNVIPDDVRMEFGVRASTVSALIEVNRRVNAAIREGAAVVGAGVEIIEDNFYLPCIQNRNLGEIYYRNAADILGKDRAENVFGSFRGSSTDASAIASLMPAIHPYFGGAVGSPHGAEFEIVNDYAAYVVPAKIAAATIVDLLWDGAREARAVKESFVPAIESKEAFLEFAEKYSERKAE
ncbi:MAG: amidohydrolase [Lachnospiraceae bacterium]|nr:amidohydrolase [Lachnospiraceae bacterium]